jgi:small GTP-binding protein
MEQKENNESNENKKVIEINDEKINENNKENKDENIGQGQVKIDNSEDSEKEINIDINKEFEILSSETSQFDYNYKIIIIGDSGVGKTCLTFRATSGEFREKIPATIGFEYFPLIIKYQNKILKLEIWDTCGQEEYRSLIKSFFNNASLAIIVYAVNSKKSFSSIDEWIRQCKDLCSPATKFFLIGNKNDVDKKE